MKTVNIVLLVVATLLVGSSAALATEVVLFQDDFSGPLTWNYSDDSVYIKDNSFLYIGADGAYDDWAEKPISLSLSSNPIVIEQRIKLESGGLNYRLPNQWVWFEDGRNVEVSYLQGSSDGWHFVEYTGDNNNPVPGEDYWAVTKMVLTSTDGALYVKPDDADRGWFSTEFYGVATATWSHSSITKIGFKQPWDSVNYVDWIKVSQVPEPGTLALIAPALLGFAGIAFRRMRMA
jgi:hypothetical protein